MRAAKSHEDPSAVPQGGAQDVRAALNFIVPQDTKPYFQSSASTGGAPKVFFRTEAHEVTIHDMRPAADELSLERQGFALLRRPTALADLHDAAAVDAAYDREIEALLREATGAHRVVVFDHTRRTDASADGLDEGGMRGPASRVHVDYTVGSGPKRARDVMGAAEVERILRGGGRIVQVNVWRPMAGPVRRTPLALADARSIRPAELIATDQIFPDRVGEIYQVAHEPQQRWYWAPQMQRDEVILIKGWDSLEDGRARFTPHGAFVLPQQDAAAPPRESLEVRTYIAFEG
jgi:hypothetical protein